MQALSRGWQGFGRPAAGVVLKLWAGQRLDLALAITVQASLESRLVGWRPLLPCPQLEVCLPATGARQRGATCPTVPTPQTLVPGALGVGLSRGVRLIVAARIARSAQQHKKRAASNGGGGDEEEGEEDEDEGPAKDGSRSSGISKRDQLAAAPAGPSAARRKKAQAPPRPAPKGLGGLGLPAVPLPPLLLPDCSTQASMAQDALRRTWEADQAKLAVLRVRCRRH